MGGGNLAQKVNLTSGEGTCEEKERSKKHGNIYSTGYMLLVDLVGLNTVGYSTPSTSCQALPPRPPAQQGQQLH